MSYEIAERAIQKVWDRWGRYIPSELKKYTARDLIRFHRDEDSFLQAFTPTYERTFRPANDSLKDMSARACAGGCAAFSTAHITHSTRKLHISAKGMQESEPDVLLSHEYLHWLSHERFYPSHYRKGGNRPFQVEGITEWLTIECYPPGQATVVYTDEYRKTVAWLQADSANERRMLDFIFQGRESNLDSLKP